MEVVREAVRARYRLLPYWYTLFYNSEKSGEPLATPMWVEFPTDKTTFTIDNAHLIGK